MKALWTVGILTLCCSQLRAQSTELTRDILTDPALSSRCRDLLQERGDKVKVRQRLTGLLERNQKLIKGLPEERELMRKKLEANHITIRNELYLAELQVQSLEESVIRSGCPGINL